MNNNPIVQRVFQGRTIVWRLISTLIAAILILPFTGIRLSAFFFTITTVILISAPFFRSRFAGNRFPVLLLSALRYLSRFRMPLAGLACLVFLLIPMLPSTRYLTDVITLSLIYAVLAAGLNVIVGMTGLLHLGYAAFYAIGAYSYALLSINTSIPFWLSAPLSALFTSVVGLILAFPAIRLKGDYLAIVTLGFGEILRIVLNNWTPVTNGPNGISGIATPELLGIDFSDMGRFYYLAALTAFVSLFVIIRTKRSKTGRAWYAIREDERAAAAMGINVVRYKLFSFAFGSFWAGIAGVLFASKMHFVSPESFTFMESILVLCMVILGGLGSTLGAVLGAFALICIPELLRDVQTYRMFFIGLGLVVLMIFMPNGIAGRLRDVYTKD